MTVKFQQQLRRINYVTPTSYLELIYTFKSLRGVKAGDVNMMRSRYDVGLQRLRGCADKVAIMQKELTDLQPLAPPLSAAWCASLQPKHDGSHWSVG